MNNNGFAVQGTLDLLQKGKITTDQTEEIVNIWLMVTREKAYNEGWLDGLKSNKGKKSHQALCDMVPESDEKGVLTIVTGNGVTIQRECEERGL